VDIVGTGRNDTGWVTRGLLTGLGWRGRLNLFYAAIRSYNTGWNKAKMRILTLCIYAMIASRTPLHQGMEKPSEVGTVRQFVQSFYDWYAPKAFGSAITPLNALEVKVLDFSPEIRRALDDYLQEQKKVQDFTIGFNDDPFQDWANSYKQYSTGKIEQKGDMWLVSVNAVPKGHEYVSGYVVAKVKKAGKGWCFADIMGVQESLLSDLKRMRETLRSIAAFEAGPLRPRSAAEIASVRRFTQRFYNWYCDKLAIEFATPSKRGHDPIEADVRAVRTKRDMFTPELRRALLCDRAAQEKNTEYIVGLDSDPFVSGQDPASHYTVRKIEHRRNFWYASVWSMYGKQTHEPDVIAKVERTKGKHGWRFVNFLYSDGDNLIDTLRALKDDRDLSNKHTHRMGHP
jgi:hypothetical protein